MIKKRISTVMILLAMMTSICVVVYAAEPRWKRFTIIGGE